MPPFTYWSHTGQNGVIELPDGTRLLPFHGHTAADEQDRFYIARSNDAGRTRAQASTVAYDPDQRIGFHEPPLPRLASGRLLTVIRTAGADDYMYQAFSTDDGWIWQGLKRTPIHGHPSQLDDDPILSTYYRHGEDGVRYIGGGIWSEDDALG